MADTGEAPGAMPLPPKLDLKKFAAARPKPADQPGGSPAAPPAPKPAPAPVAATRAEDQPVDNKPSPKKVTSRIPLDAATPPTPAAPKKETSRIPPSGVGSDAPTPQGILKKSTARIPLGAAPGAAAAPGAPATPAAAAAPGAPTAPAAPGAPGVPGGPKTIRIKPAVSPATIKVARPIVPSAMPPPGPADVLTAEKRRTARISLDEAMTAEAEPAADDAAPRTVRLKKPGEVPTVKVREAAPEPAPETDAERPGTRRTIKVRRSGEEGGKPVVMTQAPGTVATADAGMERGEPEPHGAFSLLAVAAILTLLVTIYVLCTQVLGPNASLTPLSYGSPDLDLPWPGKIARTQQ